MLIEIDTTKKTITLKEKANMRELYLALVKLLGEQELENYTLETITQQIVVNPTNKEIVYIPQPQIVPEPYIPYDPYQPFQPFPNWPTTCTSNS